MNYQKKIVEDEDDEDDSDLDQYEDDSSSDL